MADAAPKALESERALLGGLLQAPGRIVEVSGVVTPDMFWNPHNGALYAMLLDWFENQRRIDMVTVPEAIVTTGRHERYGGIEYVMRLPDACPSPLAVGHYAQSVAGAHTRRAIQQLCRDAVERAASEDNGAELAAAVAADLSKLATEGATRDRSVPMDLGRHVARVRERHQQQLNREGDDAISTGLVDLDRKVIGLRPGKLVIVAGEPGMGKTALAQQMLGEVVSWGFSAGFVSLEMGEKSLHDRELSQRSGVPLQSLIRTSALSDEDWAVLDTLAAKTAFIREQMHVDDRPNLTLTQCCARIRQWHAQAPKDRPFRAFVVDYLQIMGGLGATLSEQSLGLGLAAQGFKNLAKELGCTAILLSQLKRDNGKPGGRPHIRMMKGSSGIEQAPDLVLFPYRPAHFRNQQQNSADTGPEQDAEVIVAKHRDGPTGVVPVAYDGPCVRFEDRDIVHPF